MPDDLAKLADLAIARDKDHLTNASGADLQWLIAQLACWPTRVHKDKTTNARFLMVSAAAALRALAHNKERGE